MPLIYIKCSHRQWPIFRLDVHLSVVFLHFFFRPCADMLGNFLPVANAMRSDSGYKKQLSEQQLLAPNTLAYFETHSSAPQSSVKIG